jgi:adenylate kinase
MKVSCAKAAGYAVVAVSGAVRMTLHRAFIFLGPPGAGKGTQSKRVAKQWGLLHLSTGDMLRDAISRGTDLGRVARPLMERGELVPDGLVMKMVEERLKQDDAANGFVFDGFPRTIPQAEQLDEILEKRGFGKPVVVEFFVDEEDLIRRLSGRRTCSIGGEIYNLHDARPKVEGICDRDGGKLVQRPDDRPEVVKERLRAYGRQTKPLAQYYRQQGVLGEVDASKNVEEVSGALTEIMKRAESKNGRL